MKKLALHWKILIGMVLGVLFALIIGAIGKPDAEVVLMSQNAKEELKGLNEMKDGLMKKLSILDERLQATNAPSESVIQNYRILEDRVEVLNDKISITSKKATEPKSWGQKFIKAWIKPFGTIFIRSLKLIAIPLILAALIKGVTDLKDISSLFQNGNKDYHYVCAYNSYCSFYRFIGSQCRTTR